MTERHKLAESVKEYLLGTLSDRESSILEEKYFTDPAVFQLVSQREDQLIRAYLGDRLSPAERERFEDRYLAVPELSRRVREIETQIRVGRLRFAFAGGFAAIAVCFVFLWLLSRGPATRPPVVASLPQAAPVLALRLTPGVKMSSEKAAALTSPVGKRLTITLELPGRTSPAEYSVAIAAVDADGHQRTVWSGRTLSSSGTRAQEAVIEPDSSLLRPGDYIAEIDSASGEPVEKYVFRVDPVH